MRWRSCARYSAYSAGGAPPPGPPPAPAPGVARASPCPALAPTLLPSDTPSASVTDSSLPLDRPVRPGELSGDAATPADCVAFPDAAPLTHAPAFGDGAGLPAAGTSADA